MTHLDISHKGIADTIGKAMFFNRQAYLGDKNNPDFAEPVSSTIKEDELLEMEQVDGAIRAFVRAIPTLKDKVSVFPGYCSMFTPVYANDHITLQMKKDKLYKYWHDKPNDLKRMAAKGLMQNRFDEKQLFIAHLEGCRSNKALWKDSPQAEVAAQKQWVIPLRTGGNHHVLMVVHFVSKERARVQYYNSTGNPIAPALLETMIEYLQSQGITDVEDEHYSIHEQDIDNKDIYNCGVCVFHKSAELLCDNQKIPNPFADHWIASGEDAFSENYQRIFKIYRYIMGRLLSDDGQNVEVPRRLLDSRCLTDSLISPQSQQPIFYKNGNLNKTIKNALLGKTIKKFTDAEEAEIDALMQSIYIVGDEKQEKEKAADQIPVTTMIRSSSEKSLGRLFGWLQQLPWKMTLGLSAGAGSLYLLGIFGVLTFSNPVLALFLGSAVISFGVGIVSAATERYGETDGPAPPEPSIRLEYDLIKNMRPQSPRTYSPSGRRRAPSSESSNLPNNDAQEKKATYRK